MKRHARATASRSTLIGVALLYLLLMGLVLVFSRQVLLEVSFAGSTSRRLLFALAAFVPLFLLAMIATNVVRVLREHSAGRPGTRFKLRLILFFMVVIVLASVPQALLSVNVINAGMRALFDTGTERALRGGLDVALQFYDERVEGLREFVRGEEFDGFTAGVIEDPAGTWERIRRIYPTIDGFQVFSPQFEELYAAGDESMRLSAGQAEAAGEGFVARESTARASFLRVRRSVTVEGERYALILAMSLPPGFDETARSLTEALESYTQLQLYQTEFRLAYAGIYVFFALPLLLLAILAAFYLSDEIMRPIENLEQAIARVAEGDYSFRVLSRTRDDLSVLSRSFNQMVAELERSRSKLIQTEKVAAWQEIAQRLAHEIKNPLTPIQLSAERMLRKHQNGAADFNEVFDASVRSIIREVEGLNHLLTEFRNFTRLPEPDLEQVSLRELVEEAATTYVEHAATEIHLDDIDEEFIVQADREQIRQVFSNLFSNSVEAMDGGGEIRVRADLVKRGNSYYARVQVRDSGPGIDTGDHGKVFNPYFTTKPDGTGLGLAIVERIVFDHGGQIWFETEPGLGTTFFIDIPQGGSNEHDTGSG
jgi:nitrogen fixation/metabolism regulation signal transduction histidine kinase